jgi:integrase
LCAEGISRGRITKYLYNLLKISKWLDKPFKDVEKKDIIKLIQKIENQDYTPYTKRDYKIIFKRFFRWLKGTETNPEEIRWIKTTIKEKDIKLPEELLTEEDIKKLINTAEHPRNKAMVAFLYESGCRIGELLSLRIKDIEFDEYGATVTLRGKTGMRKIRVISSVPRLSTWIENHPLRDKGDSPLWSAIGTRNRHQQILYQNCRVYLAELAKKAGIKKKVNPHAFRHSRATVVANHLTEAQMNNYFGWKQGSSMPSVYVHLSGRDMDNAILKMNGIKSKDTEKKQVFSPKKCYRCEKMNPPSGKFCLRCGAPLNQETVMKVEEKRKEMDKIMSILLKDLLKDPAVQARIENKLGQIKIDKHSN